MNFEISVHFLGHRSLVAEAGIEPASGGYEPPEVPFLHSALFISFKYFVLYLLRLKNQAKIEFSGLFVIICLYNF